MKHINGARATGFAGNPPAPSTKFGEIKGARREKPREKRREERRKRNEARKGSRKRKPDRERRAAVKAAPIPKGGNWFVKSITDGATCRFQLPSRASWRGSKDDVAPRVFASAERYQGGGCVIIGSCSSDGGSRNASVGTRSTFAHGGKGACDRESRRILIPVRHKALRTVYLSIHGRSSFFLG